MSTLSQHIASKWLLAKTPTQMAVDDLRLPVSDVRFERAMQMAAKYMGGKYRNGTIRFPYRFRDRTFPQELTVLYRKLPSGYMTNVSDGEACVSFDVFPNIGSDPRRSKIYRSFPAGLKNSKVQFGKFLGWLRIVGDAVRRYVAQAEAGQDPQFAKLAMELTASEVSVDSKGYAHDDEGNSWFVGPQYAGWFGNAGQAARALPSPPREDRYPSRPRKQRLPAMDRKEQKEFTETAIKLIVALVGKDDRRGVKFVKDIRYKSELTAKQKSYFDSLVTHHQRTIQMLPDDMLLSYAPGEVQVGKKSLTDREREKLEKVVGIWDSPLKPYLALTTLGQGTKAQKQKPKPSGGNDKQLAVLDALLAKMPSNSFAKSIRDQVAKGRPLCEKQLKAVRQMLYKSRMRSEADLFRQAAKRVAAAWLAKQKS